MLELTLYALKPSAMVDARERARAALATWPEMSDADVSAVLDHLRRAPWPVRLQSAIAADATALALLRDAFITAYDRPVSLATVLDRTRLFTEIARAYKD
jgi:hypothetical protein